MILNIKQEKKDENGEQKIVVQFGKYELKIFENSEDWNSKNINTFLINLANSTPTNEIIELSFDENNEEENYKQILMLFGEFVKEYNSSINKDENDSKDDIFNQ